MTRLETGALAAGLVTFINLYPAQALIPTLADAFHATLPHTGLTVTATLVAVALLAPFVGSLSDAYGRRRLIVGAAALLALPTALAAAAPTLDLLIAARFAQGLLLPFVFTITVAYIAEEQPGPLAIRPTGFYTIGTVFGGFGGRFIAGWTTGLLGWRAAFLVLAALTLALATLLAACLRPETSARPPPSWRNTLDGFLDQFRNPQVMATCAIGFGVLFAVVATFTYANVLLAAPPYRFGPAALGSVFVTYLAGAVATPLATRLALRIGRTYTVLAAAALIAAGLLLTLVESLPAILVGLSAVASGIFIQQAMSIGYVATAARRARSTAVGLYVTTYYVGGSLGGILPAGIWHRFAWPGCVALVLLVQLAAMILTWLAWPHPQLSPILAPRAPKDDRP